VLAGVDFGEGSGTFIHLFDVDFGESGVDLGERR